MIDTVKACSKTLLLSKIPNNVVIIEVMHARRVRKFPSR
jgi:hypothetical protein